MHSKQQKWRGLFAWVLFVCVVTCEKNKMEQLEEYLRVLPEDVRQILGKVQDPESR